MNRSIKLFNPFGWMHDDIALDFMNNKNLSIFDDTRDFVQYPKINVSEDKDSVIVTANVPGIPVSELSIEVKDRTLALSGHTKREEEEGKKDSDFYRFEREEGSFMRSITLPSPVESDNVDAKTKNGVLTITLRKKSMDESKKIHIREE